MTDSSQHHQQANAIALQRWHTLLANPFCYRHSGVTSVTVIDGRAVCRKCADRHWERTSPKHYDEPESKRCAQLRAELEAKQKEKGTK